MRKFLLPLFLVFSIGGALPGLAAAQQGPEGLFRPTVGDLKVSLSYDGTLYPDRPVSGQSTDMSLSQHRFRLVGPLLQQKDQFEWTAFAGFKALSIDTGAVLPDTGQAFPNELWDIEFGTTARWKLENGWIIGGNLGLGSASDRPFNSLDETAVNAGLNLRVPWRESFAWNLGLHYSSLSELPFPIPTVALAYEPGPHLQLVAGVPFAVRWMPTEALEFSATYVPVRMIHTQVSYRLFAPLRAYAGFDWDSQRFFRHDRSDTDARLSYYEKRVSAGIRWDITRAVSLDASGGYAFDRFWFEGEHYSDRHFNRIDLGDGPFATPRLGVRF